MLKLITLAYRPWSPSSDLLSVLWLAVKRDTLCGKTNRHCSTTRAI